MKTSPALSCLLAAWLHIGCSTEEPASKTAGDGEHIIVSRTRADEQDRKYFQAIEIHTLKATPILGIIETTDRTYLPSMSSYPECQRKVVQGHVSEDTLFVTAKVLRDTTVPTVGSR